MKETTDGAAFAQNFLADARTELAADLMRIKHCVGQLDENQVWQRPAEPLNSVGNLLLHLAGNLRWKFGTIIGGRQDDRDRPREFSERGPIPKEVLLRRLEDEVASADAALAALTPSQLLEIRNYRMLTGERQDTVQHVVLQTLLHLSGHAQEIIYITRLQRGDAYQFRTPQPSPAPDAKTLAADDVVFSGGMLPAHAPANEAAASASHAEPRETPAGSPLKDYLIDLEQEFQEQNEEGKVELQRLAAGRKCILRAPDSAPPTHYEHRRRLASIEPCSRQAGVLRRRPLRLGGRRPARPSKCARRPWRRVGPSGQA